VSDAIVNEYSNTADARCREEQPSLENFFRAKGIKTKNEMADEVCQKLQSHMAKLTNDAVWGYACSSPPR
jgi:hypothetical protein